MLKLLPILLCAVVWSCGPSTKHAEPAVSSQQQAENTLRADVESFEVTTFADSAVVTLKGILPSPAYSIARIDIKKEKHDILLTPVMQHDPNAIVIQMTIPFTEKVTLNDLDKSVVYQVVVRGQKSLPAQRLTWRK